MEIDCSTQTYDMHKQDMHNNILKDVHHTNKVWTTKEKYLMLQSNDGDDSWLGVWEVAQKNGCIQL